MSKLNKRMLASMRAKARERDFAEWCPDDLKLVAMTDEQFVRYLAIRGLLDQPAIVDACASDDVLDFTEHDVHGDEASLDNLADPVQLDLFSKT